MLAALTKNSKYMQNKFLEIILKGASKGRDIKFVYLSTFFSISSNKVVAISQIVIQRNVTSEKKKS